MKVFNLQGDEWRETREREGWRMKEASAHYLDTEKVAASNAEGKPIMLARGGPTLEYWEGED